MASAIAQVKANGIGLTDGLVSLLPNTRFSVVVFRDRGNPAGEDEVLQPFTSDRDKVHAGLRRITAAFNRDPDNTDAESYNLAFRKSYSDPQVGWNPSARKIVLVLGDAEPNGAGTDGLPGCKDRSRDPDNLSTARSSRTCASRSHSHHGPRALAGGLGVDAVLPVACGRGVRGRSGAQRW